MSEQAAYIARALRLLWGGVHELRALDVPRRPGSDWTDTHLGYFDTPEAAAEAAAALDARGARGVYVTPNPVDPALLARANNRVRKAKRGEGTKNEEVQARRALLLDFDPKRPAGVSATDAELALATDRARTVRDDLAAEGWAEPLLATSGNGAHLVYRVDLPTADGGLLEACTKALASRYSDDAVDVDEAVHNAARIWKVYGTHARKGDRTEDRPHRLARVLTAPEEMEPVPRALLEALTAQAAPPEPESRPAPHPASGDDVPLRLEEIADLLDHLRRPAESGDYAYWLSVYANLIAFSEENGHTASDARALAERWSPARDRADYPADDRGLNRGHAGAFVNLLKDAGLDYAAWLRERYRRLRGEPLREGARTDEKPKGSALSVRSLPAWLAEASTKPTPRRLCGDLLFEGELCILFAETNVGKSIFTVQIGHAVSSGAPEVLAGFPVEVDGQPVLYIDFELSAKQFHGRYSTDYGQPFAFDRRFLRAEVSRDFDFDDGDWSEHINAAIEAAIEETGARVLVVDNLTYLRDETERAKGALPLMRHLNALKRRHGLSILAIAHTPKRDGTRPITRNDLAGSRALLDLCDSCFALGESQRDEGLRYLKQIKVRETEFTLGGSNVAVVRLAKRGGFLRFDLEGYEPEDDHLGHRGSDAPQREAAEAWLAQQLQGGPRLSDGLFAEGAAAGHTKRTLYRAKDELGIKAKKRGFDGGWTWEMPDRPFQPDLPKAATSGNGSLRARGDDEPDHVISLGCDGAPGDPLPDEWEAEDLFTTEAPF